MPTKTKTAKKAAKPKAKKKSPSAKNLSVKKKNAAPLSEEIPANTNLDTLYVIDGSDKNVTLEVKAGAEGQTSDMTIRLDNTTLADSISGDFPAKVIGTNQSLDGKKLRIVATITDTSRDTNLTSLTITLKGGPADNTFPLSKEVSEEGASADYLCLIEFFNPNN